MLSVEVKHHVYLLTRPAAAAAWSYGQVADCSLCTIGWLGRHLYVYERRVMAQRKTTRSALREPVWPSGKALSLSLIHI